MDYDRDELGCEGGRNLQWEGTFHVFVGTAYIDHQLPLGIDLG